MSDKRGTFQRDLNGDSKLDLAVGDATYSNSVSVLLGFGNGTFGAQTAYTPGATVAGISSGDLDGDGKIDLVTANLNSATVSVLRGNGDGTFLPSTDFSAVGARAVIVADFNGDGKPDLAAADIYTNAVSIFLNTSH